MSLMAPDYGWAEWREEYAEELWSCYMSLTTHLNDIHILDKCEFSDFINFCQRYTNKPVQHYTAQQD
jgi:hypothetical protein